VQLVEPTQVPTLEPTRETSKEPPLFGALVLPPRCKRPLTRLLEMPTVKPAPKPNTLPIVIPTSKPPCFQAQEPSRVPTVEPT
jgi:hypothetical protein